MNGERTKAALSAFAGIFLCLFFSTTLFSTAYGQQNQLFDYTSTCSAWTFETNSRFKNEKSTSGIQCDTNNPTKASLRLSCHQNKIGIRYFGEQHFNNPTGQARINIRYSLKDAKYNQSAIFKGVSADWVAFITASEFDHPIFESLSSNKYIDIQLENSNVTERFSLNNSRKAIAQLIQSCR